MNILVTGATGFIGSHLIQQLAKQHKIIAVVRADSDLSQIKNSIAKSIIYRGYESLKSALREADIDMVVHLATYYTAEHKDDDLDDLIDSNIRFGLHLMQAMKCNGIHNLINAGTAWQYYESEWYRPVCLYAATKQAFEDLALYYADAESFKIAHLHIFDTYGPDDPRPKLFSVLSQLANGQLSELKMSDGHQKTHFVHIDDVTRAFELLVNQVPTYEDGEVKLFGLDSDRAVSIREVVEVFEKISQRNLPVRWGERPARTREVKNPHSGYERVPQWAPKIGLQSGIQEYLSFTQSKLC